MSRDSSVGIALGYGLEDRGSRVRFPAGGWEFFSSPPRQERLWGPPSLLSNGYQGLSLGVKRPGREADHSHPSSVEVKEWVELYLHSPNATSLRGAQLKKRSCNFYLYLYKKTYGWVEIQLHIFLTLALDESEWSASCSGRFNPQCVKLLKNKHGPVKASS
jgi:hypothetical protein